MRSPCTPMKTQRSQERKKETKNAGNILFSKRTKCISVLMTKEKNQVVVGGKVAFTLSLWVSDYTTKLQSSRQYGTGTKTET